MVLALFFGSPLLGTHGQVNELFKWCAPAPLERSAGARVGHQACAPEKAGTVTD